MWIKIGTVTNYCKKLGVAIVALDFETIGTNRIEIVGLGSRIVFKRAKTCFSQIIRSIEHEHIPISEILANQYGLMLLHRTTKTCIKSTGTDKISVGIKVDHRVRVNDAVFAYLPLEDRYDTAINNLIEASIAIVDALEQHRTHLWDAEMRRLGKDATIRNKRKAQKIIPEHNQTKKEG